MVLDIVAFGTSTPELAASLVGVLKGRYALGAGTVIGSDIFNLVGVLGVAGIQRPITIGSSAHVSIGALCAMVLLAVICMRIGWRLSRAGGLVLVVVAAARWGLDLSAQPAGS